MANLFDEEQNSESPLADRIRPQDFDGFYGQEDLVGEDSPLRQAIQNDELNSLIFWGPPGSGKTTLAKIIANKTDAHFVKFSAVDARLKEVRKAIKEAEERQKVHNQRTILFIDEIHRFNKAQQDAFLPYVEEGTIILIGATTENPSFEVISPLLSRSSVYTLDSLDKESMKKVLKRALEKGFDGIKITEDALGRLIRYADGDARAGLNGLELGVNFVKSNDKKKITEEDLKKVLKEHALRYDKKGEQHYNLISAFIKSMRDSDPDAALYWLARMIESGEDPKFIARRIVIFASEDIGNADPQALQVATSVARAVEFVGMPEAQINLAQGTTYLATAPKDNASYSALLKALEQAKKGAFEVPLHLRNAATNLMKKMGYGEDYEYAHDLDHEPDQEHFPEEIEERDYY